MKVKLELLDVVATNSPIHESRQFLVEPGYETSPFLPTGCVGIIVEVYEEGDVPRYFIEFSDSEGCEYSIAVLQGNEVTVVH